MNFQVHANSIEQLQAICTYYKELGYKVFIARNMNYPWVQICADKILDCSSKAIGGVKTVSFLDAFTLEKKPISQMKPGEYFRRVGFYPVFLYAKYDRRPYGVLITGTMLHMEDTTEIVEVATVEDFIRGY